MTPTPGIPSAPSAPPALRAAASASRRILRPTDHSVTAVIASTFPSSATIVWLHFLTMVAISTIFSIPMWRPSRLWTTHCVARARAWRRRDSRITQSKAPIDDDAPVTGSRYSGDESKKRRAMAASAVLSSFRVKTRDKASMARLHVKMFSSRLSSTRTKK